MRLARALELTHNIASGMENDLVIYGAEVVSNQTGINPASW